MKRNVLLCVVLMALLLCLFLSISRTIPSDACVAFTIGKMKRQGEYIILERRRNCSCLNTGHLVCGLDLNEQ